MKSLTHEDLENQVKEKLKHVSAATPQEQAEAMARELLHSRIHSKTKFEDTLATAISKLIAENEMQHKSHNEHLSKLWGQMNTAKAKLTATEAKLETLATSLEVRATLWMPGSKANLNNPYARQIFDELRNTAAKVRSFSTLTAEKKEEAK